MFVCVLCGVSACACVFVSFFRECCDVWVTFCLCIFASVMVCVCVMGCCVR